MSNTPDSANAATAALPLAPCSGLAAEIKWFYEDPIGPSCGSRTRDLVTALVTDNETLRALLQQMLDVAENCDETGYAADCGFVDIDKLHEQVRMILCPNK